MSAGASLGKILLSAGLYAGGFALVGLVFSAQIWASLVFQDRPVDLGRILGFQLTVWLLWAVVTPFIVAAARRWPIRHDRVLRGITVHLGFCIVFLIAKVSLDILATGLTGPPPEPMHGPPPGPSSELSGGSRLEFHGNRPPDFGGRPPPGPEAGLPPGFGAGPPAGPASDSPPSDRRDGPRPGLQLGSQRPLAPLPTRSELRLPGHILVGIGPNLAVYVAIIGVSHAIGYYRKLRERELAHSRLEAQLARARLQVLEMQLRPHFLFNTLNAISVLVRLEPEAAERMIVALGDLLRAVLRKSGRQEVPLGEEIELAKRYLEIESLRFRDRLTVEYTIESGLQDILVPTLILQPLVENAVEHGISRRSASGRIRVGASTARGPRDTLDPRGLLRLEVEDDGPGLPPGGLSEAAEGLGIRNTRERLRSLHGDRFRFEVGPAKEGGVLVVIEIPERRLPVSGVAREVLG